MKKNLKILWKGEDKRERLINILFTSYKRYRSYFNYRYF